ncbi:1-phosphofructokinase [Halogeometricum sp. CBA1124]|jgi:1-phosphofructokinase|uniref:1-phosphofructokinase n=1 Tax=Halogeometricum sp. CBA1124 TaxID=2668071 RepID=UPI00142BCE1A|nr:1-phosphofructokinase [Halogeometricum sp. CBA1124]MUV58308.1 hexose kinase [Halogeometricum sp. CBA1124]
MTDGDDVLTVTANPAVDHTVRVDEPLRTGTVARTDDAKFDAGGKGINVSKYLTALDVDAPATGFLGGPFGKMIRDRLDDDAVPNDFVDIGDRTRLNTTVLGPEGEYKINHDGPAVRDGEVTALVDRVRERAPDRLVVAGSLPKGVTTDDVDELASAGDWETAVDMGGAALAELDASYLACKPNRDELAVATGMAVETTADCAAAAQALRDGKFRFVVASLGPDGALLAAESGTYHAPAVPADVVDTVGAGDALLSGFLAGLTRGESERTALKTGVTVASRVVAASGTSVPDFDGIFDDRDDVTLSAARP